MAYIALLTLPPCSAVCLPGLQDIINLFLYLLRLLQEIQGNN